MSLLYSINAAVIKLKLGYFECVCHNVRVIVVVYVWTGSADSISIKIAVRDIIHDSKLRVSDHDLLRSQYELADCQSYFRTYI